MENKSTFNRLRDGLQQGIYKVINPFVRMMIKMGVTPNTVTTIGFLGNAAAAGIFVAAGMTATQSDAQFDLVALGGFTILLFSLFDMLDGQVARIGGMASRFGAMYDSVLDRYCELLTLGGIAYYLLSTGYAWGALITFLALVGSIMVSYVRARAEGLGIECKVGFMQRPERVVVTALGAMASGIVGMAKEGDHSATAIIILIIAMAVIAVLANITAFARVSHCKRQLKGKAL